MPSTCRQGVFDFTACGSLTGLFRASGAGSAVQSLRVSSGLSNSSFEVASAAVVVNVDVPQAERLFGDDLTYPNEPTLSKEFFYS